jgi:D-xylose transport system substrate-binding protein
MRTKMFALAVVGLLATGSTVACSDDKGSDADTAAASGAKGGSGTGKVGVILPDTSSSQRWATDDAKYLKEAFDKAGVPVQIENAQGDRNQFQNIADGMIASGAKVLMIANLDSGTGKAVIAKAKAAGIATIDYDRLTLNGGAQYYVSFDNVKVGQLQGQGLKDCLTAKGAKVPLVADLNGSPTDNNATQFKEGYESVLQPLYDLAEYRKGPDQSVDNWDPAQATVIFEQMMTQTNNKIQGVLAANDGIANAAIAVLKKDGLNGQVPVTGQDATVQGLQNILAGDQCMTVYKPIEQEAQAAASLAIKLYKGQKGADVATDRVKDPESGAYVAAKLLDPIAITKANVQRVIDDKFASRKAVCAGEYAKYCTAAGI